jgi:hypothetical protein
MTTSTSRTLGTHLCGSLRQRQEARKRIGACLSASSTIERPADKLYLVDMAQPMHASRQWQLYEQERGFGGVDPYCVAGRSNVGLYVEYHRGMHLQTLCTRRHVTLKPTEDYEQQTPPSAILQLLTFLRGYGFDPGRSYTEDSTGYGWDTGET